MVPFCKRNMSVASARDNGVQGARIARRYSYFIVKPCLAGGRERRGSIHRRTHMGGLPCPPLLLALIFNRNPALGCDRGVSPTSVRRGRRVAPPHFGSEVREMCKPLDLRRSAVIRSRLYRSTF